LEKGGDIVDDLEKRISDLEQSYALLQQDHNNLKQLVEIYEKRHQEDREDAKQARRSIPTWAHLAFDIFLGYMALHGH
jgi:septal ring factor EnvC (AmiA/AmiB activator)